MNLSHACVAILLSTYNGERYLQEQLASFSAQAHTDWLIYWRDDGSTDGTATLMEAFSAAIPGRCILAPLGSRMGATASFLMLLRMAVRGPVTYFAFSDQDDVWLPDKLAHGVADSPGCRRIGRRYGFALAPWSMPRCDRLARCWPRPGQPASRPRSRKT